MLKKFIDKFSTTGLYERYDGINEVLTVSTTELEMQITRDVIKVDAVQYNTKLIDPYYSVPLSRENIITVQYNDFLSQDEDDIFGITKSDVNAVLEYYRSKG